MANAYPRPGKTGGRLIRHCIATLRRGGLAVPLNSHILCAISGGADSVALARLVVRYGRRLTGPQGRVSLLHVNHGWRGVESDADEAYCRQLAQQWEVPIVVERLVGPSLRGSWEDAARRSRKAIFARWVAQGGWVLTAHHADDVAETLLWRLFTGQAERRGAGIRLREAGELRPLLECRKADLVAFLKEEGIAWREDATNQDPRFLRARMRRELMPALEAIFPQAISHLSALAKKAANRSSVEVGPLDCLSDHFRDAGMVLRQANWSEIQRNSSGVDLPGGWRLTASKR